MLLPKILANLPAASESGLGLPMKPSTMFRDQHFQPASSSSPSSESLQLLRSATCPPNYFFSASRVAPCFLLPLSAAVLLAYALFLFATKLLPEFRWWRSRRGRYLRLPQEDAGGAPEGSSIPAAVEDPDLEREAGVLPQPSPSAAFPHLGVLPANASDHDEEEAGKPYTSPALQIANVCQTVTALIFVAYVIECAVCTFWTIKNVGSPAPDRNYPRIPAYKLLSLVIVCVSWLLQYCIILNERRRKRPYDTAIQGFWLAGIALTLLEAYDVGKALVDPSPADGPRELVDSSFLLPMIVIRASLGLTLGTAMFGLWLIQCHEGAYRSAERFGSHNIPTGAVPSSSGTPSASPHSETFLPLPEADYHRTTVPSIRNRLSIPAFVVTLFHRRRRRSQSPTYPQLAEDLTETRIHRSSSPSPDRNGATEISGFPVSPSAPPPPGLVRQASGSSMAQKEKEPDKYKPPSSFSEFYEKFMKLLPFLWPRNSAYLQCLVVGCMLMLFAGRVVNVLVPTQLGQVLKVLERAAAEAVAPPSGSAAMTDSAAGGTFATAAQVFAYGDSPRSASAGEVNRPTVHVVWLEIVWYVFLRFLQGSAGAVNTLQTFMWFPVSQFTTKEISIKMFEHLHNLSLRFHLNRKTGEILRVQDRGVASVVSLLTAILFNIVPCLVDIVIACVYFSVTFDTTLGLIVFVTMSLYIVFTVLITDWRTKFRRQANLLDNAMQARAVDSLLNFETVKYYNAERFEVRMYDRAIDEYNAADWKSQFTLSVLNTIQNVVVQVGLLVGCIVCAMRIVEHTMNVSDFVLYLTYITQLYGPLNWFGSYYRVIQKNFVDMEKMLDLFREPVEVRDVPKPAKFRCEEGVVHFDQVSFCYDPRMPTLRSVSFTVPKGATVALVGPSGGGKSTILRLLFRFYDVQKGRILIDGQDIRSVKQSELRSYIGVVPQDTVLFNEDVMYNIRYGNVEASEEQCVNAAKAAHIHDRIMQFPDGYRTKVGERGLRLSGGEKQRVAIARTLLKDPRIVLLDEATSALDTHTERHIQHALDRVTSGKTTIIIAHRLSTIVHADMIIVLQGGEIVERGPHDTLMRNPDGVYYNMWLQQLRDDNRLRGMLLDSAVSTDENAPLSRSDEESESDEQADTSSISPRIQLHAASGSAVKDYSKDESQTSEEEEDSVSGLPHPQHPSHPPTRRSRLAIPLRSSRRKGGESSAHRKKSPAVEVGPSEASHATKPSSLSSSRQRRRQSPKQRVVLRTQSLSPSIRGTSTVAGAIAGAAAIWSDENLSDTSCTSLEQQSHMPQKPSREAVLSEATNPEDVVEDVVVQGKIL